MPNALPYTDYEVTALIRDDRGDNMLSNEQANAIAAEIQKEFKSWLFQRFKLRPRLRFEKQGDDVVNVPELTVKVVRQGWA